MSSTIISQTPVALAEAPAAERMVNDQTRVLNDATWPIGSVAHQGDLILVRIDPKADIGMLKRRTDTQLAIGNTQGSRHILTKHAGLFDAEHADKVCKHIKKLCPLSDVQPLYVGPVFRSPAYQEHPEHADYVFDGDMLIVVVYQRNLDAEQREARAMD